MRKMIKIFLWVVKFCFIAFCLLTWIRLLPLGETIIPAVMDRQKYYSVAKDFIREKYGEDIKVRIGELDLYEFNMGNTGIYTYYFDLQGEEYYFAYEINPTNGKLEYYGDTAQSKELHQAVDEALNEQYGERVSLDDIDNKAVILGWNDSNLYCDHWAFSDTTYYDKDAIFVTKYTGDNLEKFPIWISLYYDVGVRGFEEEDLRKLYYEVKDTLKEYDIDCNEVYLYCERIKRHWFKVYHITETSKGIEIEKHG